MVRPEQITFSRNGSDLYDPGDFAYDELGNIHQIGDDVYRYDKASRLTYGSVSRAGSRWEAYQYDVFDNMVERQGEADPTPFPIHVDPQTNRALGDGDIEYDPYGNLTKVGPPSFTMSYDALDMQVYFEQHSGNPTEYLYAYGPGDRRLLTFEVPTGKLLYQLRGPGGEVLREYEVLGSGGASFAHQKDLIHGPDGLIATISRSGDTHYFHKDHLGTPRSVTDSAGVRTGKHDYYPYGQETPNHPQHPDQTVKWTGHQRDLHGFSDYMMGRTCLYPLRRFASVDPARDGWNLYAYGRNNPVKYVDPDGYRTAAAFAEAIQRSIERQREETTTTVSDGSVFGVALATVVGSSLDLAALAVDPLRLGQATGDAIGSGAGGLEATIAVGTDVLRGAMLVAPAVKGVSLLRVPRGTARAGIRSAPRNLSEKLALDEAGAGAGRRIMQGKIKDPSFPENVWAKMEHVHKNPDGTQTVIHYWDNLETGVREGFKFK